MEERSTPSIAIGLLVGREGTLSPCRSDLRLMVSSFGLLCFGMVLTSAWEITCGMGYRKR